MDLRPGFGGSYISSTGFIGVPENFAVEGARRVLEQLRDGQLSCDSRFSLRNEACALSFAHINNKILSLSNSRTRILAHQVESTHRIVNSLNHRFILADEVGLGKTVEAGLVIKELIYRFGYAKILIIAPASLLHQWQNEMLNKFNENFDIIDRKALERMRSITAGNPWKHLNRALCSLDFLKNKRFADDLKRTEWDIVVFDEAHRLRKDSMKTTLAYSSAEILAGNTKSLLLLTATPFRGKLEELYYLIRLADRNLLGPFQTFFADYCIDGADLSSLRSKIGSVLIRRTKKDVGGFTLRYAKTVRFALYPEERTLYDATTRYVVEEFNRALQSENRAVGFVMTVFQKLLDSSSYALRSALQNRINNLSVLYEKGVRGISEVSLCGNREDPLLFDTEDIEEINGIVGVAQHKQVYEIGEEIAVLKGLVDLADQVKRNKKGEKLLSLLKKLRSQGQQKFLIFTQFKTTQEYLRILLKGFKVETFNGSMDRNQKEKAIADFRENGEVLICTEAGGEGRNLQFCNILINYDLPWSPLKIEQRIGRIHRFGQSRDVFIYNFSTRDTVAERVLEVLAGKLKLFEESIGAPDVLLGQMEDEIKLTSLFMDMAAGLKTRDDVMSHIDDKLEQVRKSYEKLEDLTVAKNLDFNYDEYYAVTLKERQYSNRRIESFVNRCREADPVVVNKIGDKNLRSGLYPVMQKRNDDTLQWGAGTFDSRMALEDDSLEFLAFGHPVVDEIFSSCMEDGFAGHTGIKVIDFPRIFMGLVFIFIGEFNVAETISEMLPVVVDPTGALREIELNEIERSFLEQEGLPLQDERKILEHAERLTRRINKYYDDAETRLTEKIISRMKERQENLGLILEPEVDKIRESYSKKLRELHEQLERQECRGKWFGKNMKSAIGKTRREIERVELEQHLLMEKNYKLGQIGVSIRLFSAGILMAGPEGKVL